jgi:uncharacterized membrane protein
VEVDDASGDAGHVQQTDEVNQQEESRVRHFGVDRLVAFTDGVFAIIITILVLDLQVPDLGSGQSLRQSIDDVQPTFTAWVISFLLTGMYWVVHRALFAEVRYADLPTVWLNLLFLLPVCLVPYASSAIGEYPDDPLAMHLYGTVLIAATVMRVAMTYYLVRRHHLLWEPQSTQKRRLWLSLAGFPLVVYTLAMVVADASTAASLILYLVVPGLHLVLVAVLRTNARTRSAAEDVS